MKEASAMSCEEFELLGLDSHRDDSLSHDARQRASQHARFCGKCAALRDSWLEAQADLVVLSESTQGAVAPPHIEMRLLQQFRLKHQARSERRTLKLVSWALAAAVLLVCTASVWNWQRWRANGGKVNGADSATVAENTGRAIVANSGQTTVDSSEILVAGADEGDFTQLPGSSALGTEDASVFRVGIQRGSLAALGLPVNEERAGDWIQVDLLVASEDQRATQYQIHPTIALHVFLLFSPIRGEVSARNFLVRLFRQAHRLRRAIPDGPPPPPMGGPMELIGFEGMHGGKLVKGAPFSATSSSENTQTLQDGTVIHRTSQGALYRDSQGRSRHEMEFTGAGPLAAAGGSHKMVTIADPVAGVHYMLNADKKVAHKSTMHAHGGDAATGDKAEAFHQKMQAREQQEEASGELKTESLGTQMVNGVNAQGTRTTHTIAAGKIGNDKPIQVVAERWYSPDLQIVVKSTRTDPRFGTSSFSLTNIQKAEPAAALFTVPADYAVKEGGPGGMRGGRKHGGPHGPGQPAPSDAPAPPTNN